MSEPDATERAALLARFAATDGGDEPEVLREVARLNLEVLRWRVELREGADSDARRLGGRIAAVWSDGPGLILEDEGGDSDGA